ncbi:YvaD family protein [Brevibacillus sp. SIMBA_040]|uniref:YvaD family protein n=1 Tax=unclassified Brevibacillus TaxID=2684853 RepID=UPI003979125D
MRRLRPFFWLTDVGFVVYWLITFLEVLPKQYMYQDYTDTNLVAWNLSFFPLDIFISLTGFASLYAYHKGKGSWQQLALLSLVLTFCSGLQAIAFWAFKADFDWSWWIPNLYLLIYPLFFLPRFMRERSAVS